MGGGRSKWADPPGTESWVTSQLGGHFVNLGQKGGDFRRLHIEDADGPT